MPRHYWTKVLQFFQTDATEPPLHATEHSLSRPTLSKTETLPGYESDSSSQRDDTDFDPHERPRPIDMPRQRSGVCRCPHPLDILTY